MKNNVRLLPFLFVIALCTAAAGAPEASDLSATDRQDPHAPISCSLCHRGEVARAVAYALPGEPDPRSQQCRGCHSKQAAGRPSTAAALGFHTGPRSDCTRCHLFHDTARVKTAVGDLAIGKGLPRGVPDHCAGCHEAGAKLAGLSPAHLTAARLYHRDAASLVGKSPSQGCLNCHAPDSDSPWQNETVEDRLTFNEHATHPLGVAAVAGSGQDERRLRPDLDPRLPLFDGRIECQTCHALTSRKADLLVAFSTEKDLCLGCHQLKSSKTVPEEQLMATMVSLENDPGHDSLRKK